MLTSFVSGKLLRQVQPELMDQLIEATKEGNHAELLKLCPSHSEPLHSDAASTGFESEDHDEVFIYLLPFMQHIHNFSPPHTFIYIATISTIFC